MSDSIALFSATNKKPDISVILPTFNEAKNVAALLKEIHIAVTAAGLSYECIFVDDSKDDTPAVIARESKNYYPNITFVKRRGLEAKTGLTQAFRRGFAEARGEIIVCMDTDLQHPPAIIPSLVEAARRPDVDVAVGSRYTLGGSAEGLNGFFRHLVSRATTIFVHLLLPGTRATTDPMTGFFVFKRSLLSSVSFSSYGFKILVELLSGMKKPRVIDVPFTFQRRNEEVSKATLRQGFVAYLDIIKLFLSPRRGSGGLRLLLLSVLTSIVFILVWYFNSFFQEVNQEASLKSYTIFSLPILAFFSLRWAYDKYQYENLTRENILIFLGYSGFLIVVAGYILPKGFDLLGILIGIPIAAFIVDILLKSLLIKDYGSFKALERWFAILVVGLAIVSINFFTNDIAWWGFALLGLYSVGIAQGLFALYLMIYAWERGDSITAEATAVDSDSVTQHSFTVIVPCKHEMNTIADTLRAMNRIDYPEAKKQILVVIHSGTDDGTIRVVKETIDELRTNSIALVTYNQEPINKPHGLNESLKYATGDFVVIFDAEDEPHPDLFKVVNKALNETGADILQSGVQLMNYNSNWYSTFNVLEYYFWFKSSLHYYAKQGVVPLGGVSVFFRRTALEKVGGWDMTCLTEDAEIGMRLSQAGMKTTVIYDAKYATREETPPTLISFIKQRTRWAQGFLQILWRGHYLYFPTFKQRLLALYVLSWPLIIPAVFLLLPLGIFLMIAISLPPMLALISNISLLLFLVFVIVQTIGFYEFTREYKIKFPWTRIPLIVIMFYPYTVLLAVASLRALYRNFAQITNWEKTEHVNTHRMNRVTTTDQELTS